MLRWMLLLVAIKIPGTILESPKSLPKDYQAEFAWKFYKQMSQTFQRNVVSAPHYIREIFACLSNVSISSEGLKNELWTSMQLPKTSLIHIRYDLQRERFQCRTELKVSTLAAGFGTSHVLDKGFRKTMDHCRIHQTRITVGETTIMTQMLNGMMRNASNNVIGKFLNANDVDRRWDSFIMNSVRFTVPWKFQFKEDEITVCPFYASKSEQILTELMQIEEYFRYGYFSQWNLEAVEMPFQDESPFSILLLHAIDGSLSKMIKSFDHNRFRDIYRQLKKGKTTVIIPKGSIRVSYKASNMIQLMGLKTPFSKKIFKVYNTASGVSVGDIMQKVSINFEVGVGQKAQNIPGRDMGNQFHGHQPFIYVILDRQELMPIIVGHVVKPPKTDRKASDYLMCQNPPKWTY